MDITTAKVPATIVTGFLGAGKTTLLRHLLGRAGARRIALIVNEFGELGIDGELLRGCGVPGCDEASLIELTNGCICCTVADDFIPAMEALLGRDPPPEHIVIETSGLALPKPLIKAFDWPAVRSRLTVDGVIAVLDAPAVEAGRFADDPAAVARQRASDAALDHDNPLAEVFEDQIAAADLVLLNKTDLLDDGALARVREAVALRLPRAVRMIATVEGRVDPSVLLGLEAAAEDDLAARPSHHDALDGAHAHDDFESFSVCIHEQETSASLIERLREAAAVHGILRVKGFAALRGRPMRLVVQGVGSRFQQHFDRPWAPGEARQGQVVVIGERGLDRAAITAAIGG